MTKHSPGSITMNKVAAHCSLSVATVSRALNAPEKLKPHTLTKVRRALDELGYRYNPFAASLSRNASNLIGVIVGNILENTYAITLGCIQEFASQNGLNVLFSISDFSSDKERNILQTFREYRTAMIIVIGPGTHCHEHVYEIVAGEIPCLILWETYPGGGCNYIGIDAEETLDKAVGYLASLGHSRIGLGMSMHSRPRRAGSRIASFTRALQCHGLKSEDHLVLLDDTRQLPFSAISRGKAIMQAFLKKTNRPTAVLYPTGGMAEGGIVALYEQGLSFPRDMSILCLGDDDITRHFHPAISALDSRMDVIFLHTRRGIEEVMRGANPCIQQQLGTELIIRSSCGCPAR